VTCVNSEIADTIEALGVPRHAIEIAPAFLPVSLQDAVVPEKLQRWLQSRSHVVSTVLFFRPEYGFDVLAKAMASLRRAYPRIGCIAMGSGEDQSRAEELLRAEGLNETFLLSGDLDHQICLAVMSGSTVFVRPTYHDGDSISVREALMLGVPVVASNVGNRPAGTILFEPGDADGLVRGVDRAIAARAAGRGEMN
jgi:glycosyltransferase involved in cell wall biosynthesis